MSLRAKQPNQPAAGRSHVSKSKIASVAGALSLYLVRSLPSFVQVHQKRDIYARLRGARR